MSKYIIIGLIVFGVLTGAVFFFVVPQTDDHVLPVQEISQAPAAFDGKNASYVIEGAVVTLVNGVSESEVVSDAATRTVTRYFGNKAHGDLNGDGAEDIGFLISQDRGGSGLFYYAVAALKTSEGYRVTNTFFIGDRIAPQVTNIRDGKMYVDYAERYPGEPMTARPSLGAEKILVVAPDSALIAFEK